MGNYVGIDLGTAFSAVSYIDETGRPTIVNNDRDANITPSVVAEYKGELVVGEPARRQWGNDDRIAAARFKRDMGTTATHSIGDKQFTPTDLSSIVLNALRHQTETKIGEVTEAVVTIPANFAHEARDATIEAAKLAGLNLQYIINEPTAAALYYAYESGGELSGTYAVFDLGGGTFDVSIIGVSGSDVEVKASNGIHKLGGDDFDRAVWQLIAEKYEAATGSALTYDEFSLNDAEDAKKKISERKRTTVEIEREFIDISRLEFEDAVASLLEQIEMMCEATLDEAGMQPADITAVFLAGGSTRVPAVASVAEKVFKQTPTASANVDEVVALGAALYAAYKSDGAGLSDIQKSSVAQLKVAERTTCYFGTISIATSEGRGDHLANSILIKKGESIPCSVTQTFFTAGDNQRAIDIKITESKSEETDPKFVKIIHEEEMLLPEGRPRGQEIEVTYAYDENQVMKAYFKDVATGQSTEISLSMVQDKPSQSPIDKFLLE